MGGMLTWAWGETHPDFMDGLVPLASTPAAMAARNWMMRRLMIETIKGDPAFQGGDYTQQPPSLKYANAIFSAATSGGTLSLQARAGTHAEADRLVDSMLAEGPGRDANDTIYQFDASRDYDPEPGLGRIKARVLAVNSADDERNPHETGLMEKLMARLPAAASISSLPAHRPAATAPPARPRCGRRNWPHGWRKHRPRRTDGFRWSANADLG